MQDLQASSPFRRDEHQQGVLEVRSNDKKRIGENRDSLGDLSQLPERGRIHVIANADHLEPGL